MTNILYTIYTIFKKKICIYTSPFLWFVKNRNNLFYTLTKGSARKPNYFTIRKSACQQSNTGRSRFTNHSTLSNYPSPIQLPEWTVARAPYSNSSSQKTRSRNESSTAIPFSMREAKARSVQSISIRSHPVWRLRHPLESNKLRLIDPGPTFHADFSRRRNRFPLPAFPRSVCIIYIHRRAEERGQEQFIRGPRDSRRSLCSWSKRKASVYVCVCVSWDEQRLWNFEIWDDEWRSVIWRGKFENLKETLYNLFAILNIFFQRSSLRNIYIYIYFKKLRIIYIKIIRDEQKIFLPSRISW